MFGTLCGVLILYITGTSGHPSDFIGNCPVQKSIPGFRHTNISVIGVAVLENATEDIEAFLDMGCDPNFNETFLTYIDKFTQCVNPIFQKLGISCSRVEKLEGFTPLILAVLHGTAETVYKLAQNTNIKLDSATSDSKSALWLAANSGMLVKVKIIVEAGADIEMGGGEDLMTALGASVKGNHSDVIKYLIRKDANVNSRDSRGATPSHFAVSQGNLEILKVLKEAGADLDVMDDTNVTLLTIAVDANDQDIVDFLINQAGQERPKRNITDMSYIHGHTPIFYHAHNDHLAALQTPVKAGADLDIFSKKAQYSPLILAILNGRTDSALLLIKNGADVNKRSSKGFTASFVAAQEGNLPVLEALVAAEANLEIPEGSSEWTPLLIAANEGYIKIVKFLKRNGADLTAKDTSGKTAMDLAREKGFDDIVQICKI